MNILLLFHTFLSSILTSFGFYEEDGYYEVTMKKTISMKKTVRKVSFAGWLMVGIFEEVQGNCVRGGINFLMYVDFLQFSSIRTFFVEEKYTFSGIE